MFSFECENDTTEYQNDTTETECDISAPNYHSLLSIITFILLPPLWFLSIPSIVFSSEAKKCYNEGYTPIALRFAQKARKFAISAWIVFALIVLAGLSLYLFTNY
ncbi:MAG: CD225/dispanin family protein [Clostridia bacterium]